MTQSEAELGRRWFDEVWNKGRREAIAEMLAPEAILYDGETKSVGPEGFYPFFDRLRATLADIHITVHDSFGEGDRICVRWSCSGKHSGEGLGIPASGKSINVTGMCVMRIANGKIAGGWQNWDMLGMMHQIQGSVAPPTYISQAAHNA